VDTGGAALSTFGRRWDGAGVGTIALLTLPALFLAVFMGYPLQGILRESFFGEAAHGGLRPLWQDSFYLERLWFTAWQATVSTLLTIAIALPCAYVLARYEFAGKPLLLAVATVPFVLPAIVVAVAFTALLGPSGLANDLTQRAFNLDQPPIRLMNTIWIILLAHVFYNFAVAARIIAAYWANLDPRYGEAAEMLGAGRLERFVRITLPLLRAPILAAASLVFLFTFTSFGVILILGGPRFGTLETEIYRETVFLFRLPVAGALAVVQLAFTFAILVIYTRAQRTRASGGFRRQRQRRWQRRDVALVAGVSAFMLAVVLLPLGALVERSFHGPGGYTLDFYRSLDDNPRGQVLFVAPLEAIRNSVGFAVLTLALALPLGTFVAYGSLRARRLGFLVEPLFLLPLGVSAVTLGLGFIVTLDRPPLDIRAAWYLPVIAHTLIAYPFVARTVASQLRGIDPRLREAARTLGAGPLRVFLEVDLPQMWRGLAVGAVFAFAISMGEFGATLLIARPEWPTIPVAIFRYLGQPGALNYGQALAMSTILMAVTAAGFFLLERLRFRELGTF
jgi:thiamine transport system permease protein